ncbi:MAG: RluA family pseudouridine synthase [Desulfobacteraceae bacterium]|nr:RluA family pseudouridine synthase [Desulfobacteraceae bacterium]
MKIKFIIAENQVDLRLDQVLSRAVENCSRSQAADLISRGQVKVSCMKKRPGYRVKLGEAIMAQIPEPVDEKISGPESMDLSLLFEDDHILVIDKPADLVVHPGPGNLCGTLVNGLLSHVPALQGKGWDPLRPGIVHRLDKDTSGVIVVAKTLNSLSFLQKEFKQRRVEKRYLALVEGKDIAPKGEIVLPLGRHPIRRKIMAVDHGAGKFARTSWQLRQRFAEACLLDVRLHTGRTHQIRVHFHAMGMPLLGDKVYQYRRNRRNSSLTGRQMLHSWRIKFRHPYSGRQMSFEARMPADFLETIAQLDIK